jgi:hypothetical protein
VRKAGPIVATVVTAALIAALAVFLVGSRSSDRLESSSAGQAPPTTGPDRTDPTPGDGTGPQPAAPAANLWSDPGWVAQPYPPGKVSGLLTFRGNPTRSYYGSGPVPRTTPVRDWVYPRTGGLCGTSIDEDGEKLWCGTGWTGQPALFEREGRTWAVFGAYDYGIHFLDADTGRQIIPPFRTGDIIKGSVTIDPDGFPLVYSGSRDNNLRVIAFDGSAPRELWRLNAYATAPTQWNDDWDGSPLVIGDYLFEGGENSRIHIVKLNRGYDKSGRATVNPRLVWSAAGWDAELVAAFGSTQTSIENSVAIYRNTMYFANSAGLVQGWNLRGLKKGDDPRRVFRFWTGDDTDATITIDSDGMLYVGSEYEKGNARSQQVGQMMKLDPRRPGDPLVWSVKDTARRPGGIWGTPALHADVVLFATDGGDLLAIDRVRGSVLWRRTLPGPLWQSPVVVDDVLLMGDCSGVLHAYDVSDPRRRPPELWRKPLGGCIESTPAVHEGRIYVGTRGGQIHALAAR